MLDCLGVYISSGMLNMINGLLGKKIGMIQVFDDARRLIPVTVIEAGPCGIVQLKGTGLAL